MAGPRLSVRNLEARDVDSLSHLIIETLRRVNIQDYPSEAIERLAPSYSPSSVTEKAKSHHMIVAEIDGKVVGTASIEQDRVRNVFVDRRMHKRGIGRALMREIETYARSHGQARVFLFASLSARGFYEKLGYVSKGRVQHDLGDISIEEVRMEKDLAASPHSW